MIVYSKWDVCDYAMNFHDVEYGHTIVRVHGAAHLLFMCPLREASQGDWCIFDKVGCTINFTDARN